MAVLQVFRSQMLKLLLDEMHADDQPDRIRWVTMLLYAKSALGRTGTRSANIDRERGLGHVRLMRDYFVDNPVYTPKMFRRCFQMHKQLFEHILAALTSHNEYFQQRPDAVGVMGLSAHQKITAAIWMLAYDRSADELDEYIQIGETTTLLCLREFCQSVVEIFGSEYLRAPTPADIDRILRHSNGRGFPGMLGSLDCMHWEWKNCPRSWAGQFAGRSGSSSIILEAVATYDLWVWHAFFGILGAANNINVMDRSPLFADLFRGVAPQVTFTVNNSVHDMAYFLTDGIYPEWPVSMKMISNPLSEKRKLFATMQEAYRKDIERCFGVLQARWEIIKNPSRLWSRHTLHHVMIACIILHNMIVEDDQNRGTIPLEFDDIGGFRITPSMHRDERLPTMLQVAANMRNRAAYHQLQTDLVEHLWDHKGRAS